MAKKTLARRGEFRHDQTPDRTQTDRLIMTKRPTSTPTPKHASDSAEAGARITPDMRSPELLGRVDLAADLVSRINECVAAGIGFEICRDDDSDVYSVNVLSAELEWDYGSDPDHEPVIMLNLPAKKS